jgi:hypothetical protein
MGQPSLQLLVQALLTSLHPLDTALPAPFLIRSNRQNSASLWRVSIALCPDHQLSANNCCFAARYSTRTLDSHAHALPFWPIPGTAKSLPFPRPLNPLPWIQSSAASSVIATSILDVVPIIQPLRAIDRLTFDPNPRTAPLSSHEETRRKRTENRAFPCCSK